jgi:hypothetical protein
LADAVEATDAPELPHWSAKPCIMKRMELWGYDLSEAAYLDRAWNETIAYRLAKPLALVTITAADAEELRKLASFLSDAADRLDTEEVGPWSLHYRGWSEQWIKGTADLAVGGFPDDPHAPTGA